jgi:hypothetical protein
MIILVIVLSLISILICYLTLWAIGKLNRYIGKLEEQIELQLDRIDEVEELLTQSNIKNKKIVKRNLMPTDED